MEANQTILVEGETVYNKLEQLGDLSLSCLCKIITLVISLVEMNWSHRTAYMCRDGVAIHSLSCDNEQHMLLALHIWIATNSYWDGVSYCSCVSNVSKVVTYTPLSSL